MFDNSFDRIRFLQIENWKNGNKNHVNNAQRRSHTLFETFVSYSNRKLCITTLKP